MKRKRLTALLVLLLCMLILSAFANAGELELPELCVEHNFDLTHWESNSSVHWHKCVNCGEQRDVSNHMWDGLACSVCGYKTPDSQTGSGQEGSRTPAQGSESTATASASQTSASDPGQGETETEILPFDPDTSEEEDKPTTEEKKDLSTAVLTGIRNRTYTGKAIRQSLTVTLASTKLRQGTDYTVRYQHNRNVGTAKVIVTGTGNYTGTVSAFFKIKKAANPMKLKVTERTFARKKLTKKATFSIGSKKAVGKVSYRLSKTAKKAKIKVSRTGKVTIPKKCKKGVYLIAVRAEGNKNYKSASKTVIIRVK